MERELDEELRSYREIATEENLRDGMPREEAERKARIELGGAEQVKELDRAMRPGFAFDSVLSDVRYALRSFRKSPGFSGVVVLTLALGFGVNAAIFSVVNDVLLRPLPYDDPDRLVMLWSSHPEIGDRLPSSPALIREWERRSRSFEAVVGFNRWQATWTDRGMPELVNGAGASARLFEMLGVQSALGRTFQPTDLQSGNENVVVLSDRLWNRRFNRDPDIVGQPVALDGAPFTVIGVMPAGFWFPVPEFEFWVPLVPYPEMEQANYLVVFAGLRPNVSIDQAQSEMNAVALQLPQEFQSQFQSGRGVSIVSLHEQFAGDLRPTLLVLLGAVGFVLLIACVNTANLMLVRTTGRSHEIAIRAALGAGRRRVVRQVFTEGLILSGAGAFLAVLIARQGLPFLTRMIPPEQVPQLEAIRLDATILGFTLVLSILTAIAFGMAPALWLWTRESTPGFRDAGRRAFRRNNSSKHLLAASEIALALTLMVGAALMTQSFWRLYRVESGFDAENVLAARVILPPTGSAQSYQGNTAYMEDADMVRFFQTVLDSVASVPGVDAVGVVNDLPMTGN